MINKYTGHHCESVGHNTRGSKIGVKIRSNQRIFTFVFEFAQSHKSFEIKKRITDFYTRLYIELIIIIPLEATISTNLKLL